MEQDRQPKVFPFNLIDRGKELFEKFKKVPMLSIPVGAAIVGLVFYILLVFLLDSCLVTLLPPFVMLGIFWSFDVKRGRKLLIAGVIACTVMMLIEAFFFVGLYTETEPATAQSDDAARVLRNGTVSPFRGDGTTLFNFTIDVYVNQSVPISDVNVSIAGLNEWANETMLAGPRNDTVAQYYFATTVSDPVNQFVFWANVSGTWYLAADYSEGTEAGLLGPIYSDTWEIAKPMLYYSSIQAYLQFFTIYALLVGMIWWTRRARRMREKSLEKWEQKRKETEAQTPKDETKVPSLAKAMGLESGDTFVCSECGADVPSDATKCPMCGEKFE